jgi:DNA-binding transcriptional ArsR family regulator
MSSEFLKTILPEIREQNFLSKLEEFQREKILSKKYFGPPGRTVKFEGLESLARIVGSETRLKILRSLLSGEMNVMTLAKRVGVSASTLMEHMSILEREEAVLSRSEGRMRIYSLANSEKICALCKVIETWSAEK